MNGKCFEIGTIQAFLDGETTPDVSLRLTDHVAACDGCARLIAEAEDESSMVFSLLGRELDTLVPTQRLWLRINETLEIEKSRTPVWQRFFGYITAGLANPSLAMAAGIILMLGLFVVVNLRDDSGLIAGNGVSMVGTPPTQTEASTPVRTGPGDVVIAPATSEPQVAVSSLNDRQLRSLAQKVSARTDHRSMTVQPAIYSPDAYLPGEESYVKTITDLKESVDFQKDAVLTPSTRVSYERDMAVVNDSIQRMREVVRKNPRNQAARQMLFASYQDKIDLLNSVAQREELMASLR